MRLHRALVLCSILALACTSEGASPASEGAPQPGGSPAESSAPAARPARPAAQQGAPKLEARAGLEGGRGGERFPQPADERLAAQPVHQDASGGCEQELRVVAAAPGGGFGAVWLDRRNGNMGLYLGLIDDGGALLCEERPLYGRTGTFRQLDPGLGFLEGMEGLVAWRSNAPKQPPVLVRRFEGVDGFPAPAVGIGDPGEGRARGKGRSGFPGVFVTPRGDAWVTWLDKGLLEAQLFHAKGKPQGGVEAWNGKGPPVAGNYRLAANAAGDLACAWTSKQGVHVWTRDAKRRVGGGAAGAGELFDVEADPAGGWWLLVDADGAPVLRHLGPAGQPDGREVELDGAARGADLAVWKHGLAVVREVKAVGPARLELALLDAAGAPLPAGAWSPQVAPGARTARLASRGPDADRLLVAWTDDGDHHGDVRYAVVALDRKGAVRATETKRWNTDEASAIQMHGDVASNGAVAVMAWEDERDGYGQVWLRALGADGRWRCEECAAAPLDSGGVEQNRASVAVAADGGFLVAWNEQKGAGLRLRARRFAPDVTPLGPAFEVDPGHATGGNAAADVVALDGGGWALAWVREGAGICARVLGPDGGLGAEPQVLGGPAAASAENPDLAQLDDGRLVVAWDHASAQNRRALAARLLDAAGAPFGGPLSFPYSGEGGDLDPAVAPGPKNGFVLAWTGFDSRARDVIARTYTAEGQPAGKPLAVSHAGGEQDFCDLVRLADGSWLVAWEDDLSGFDHVVARRILPDGRRMGPRVNFDTAEASFAEDRSFPRVAPLGDGWVGLWSDLRRQQGQDVYVRAFGERFDRELSAGGGSSGG